MTQEEKDKLVAAWIELYSTRDEVLTSADKEAKYDKYFWAWENLNDLTSKNPKLAWELILQIHRTEHSDWVTFNLAAGPLESLLVYCGDVVIDWVEKEARKDPKFNDLLGGVWRNSMTKKVWERVQAICNTVW
jgi:hypothetical protein